MKLQICNTPQNDAFFYAECENIHVIPLRLCGDRIGNILFQVAEKANPDLEGGFIPQ